ncbi:hypothetical protein F2P81_000843 [Scophthalmus maximus]|uniref:Deoxyribodipyrimidine photo-lyase n=1 Tax=Scophthalmus maximus TaxID=52904 RepID=A0A6A4TU84_SCOMX|nr:hypothetical protein F2P81_000843 [Scophthalmus maximus]
MFCIWRRRKVVLTLPPPPRSPRSLAARRVPPRRGDSSSSLSTGQLHLGPPLTCEDVMSGKKRTAKSAPAGKQPAAKLRKSAPTKEEEEKVERAGGWLQDLVMQQRSEEKEMKFNKKRLRVISDAEKMKPGSEGVLYWMSRDQRVQADRSLGAVVTDFSPLKEPLQWLEDVKKALPNHIPLIQVDAHNVVPCWVASPKLEYSARTIRGKITNHLPEFLTDLPLVEKHPHTATRTAKPIDWDKTLASLQIDRAVSEPQWATPGTKGGMAMLESFIDVRLKLFGSQRNDPNANALSNLSPWIRFGHLSAQRVALQVQRNGKHASQSVPPFIEELVVRRELTDNYCFYNKKYGSLEGAYEWAQKTLRDHANDERPFLYTRQQLEEAQTHDKLWNAAQYQMVSEGKMHGFLRMYWAKKILEWMSSPEEALSTALYLNDRYSLDGQDPNGFVGCMWSICGIHDQGWAERAVFGKIRYMNYKGCTRKFDVPRFERKFCPKNPPK